MTEVTGSHFMTITATAKETYHIKDLATVRNVDIYNLTEENILISRTNDFAASEAGIGSYITLAGGSAANGLTVPKDGFYIKATAAGDITIKGAS